jgi:Effector Associated Constant Component 1
VAPVTSDGQTASRQEAHVEISISADDELALEQFYRWLREDVDLARTATVTRTGTAGSGHMGVFEIISMTVSNATALTGLALAYANWRKARKDPPPLKFTVEGPLTDELREVLRKLNQPTNGDD